MKFWATAETALLGAVINFNPQTGAAAVFSQGHNLHHLSLAPVIVLSLPIRPPSD